MAKFHYVYILQSEVDPARFYTGFTDDLRARFKNHNTAASATRQNGSLGA